MARSVYTDLTMQGGATVKGVPTPSASTDAANKAYVDNTIAGLSWKDDVRVATTANGTLATAYANGQTVDGISLVTGDRILLKNQTSGSENGIYTVNASGAPTRATDADASAEILGMICQVNEGTTLHDTIWLLTTNAPITIGSTSLAFQQFNGTSYTAGNGINISGAVVSAVADAGIVVTGSGIAVDTAVVVRKYAADLGDGAATSFTKTHSLGTQDLTVLVYQKSDGSVPECGLTVTSTTVVVDFGATVPTSAQFRLVAHG